MGELFSVRLSPNKYLMMRLARKPDFAVTERKATAKIENAYFTRLFQGKKLAEAQIFIDRRILPIPTTWEKKSRNILAN